MNLCEESLPTSASCVAAAGDQDIVGHATNRRIACQPDVRCDDGEALVAADCLVTYASALRMRDQKSCLYEALSVQTKFLSLVHCCGAGLVHAFLGRNICNSSFLFESAPMEMSTELTFATEMHQLVA